MRLLSSLASPTRKLLLHNCGHLHLRNEMTDGVKRLHAIAVLTSSSPLKAGAVAPGWVLWM